MQAQKMNTLWNAKIGVAAMTTLAVAIVIPGYGEWYLYQDPCKEPPAFVVEGRPYAQDRGYLVGFRVIFLTLAYEVIPMFFIILPFNAAVLRSLRKMQLNRKSMRSYRKEDAGNRKRKSQDGSSAIIVAMVMMFILFRLPGCCLTIAERIKPYTGGMYEYKITWASKFTNTLIVLNSAVNFVIYFIVGKSFRKTFRAMCCGPSDSEDMTSTRISQIEMERF
jgi:neuropeptide Y receptor type 1